MLKNARVLFIALFAIFALSASAMAKGQIEVSVSLTKSAFSAAESVTADVTFSNNGNGAAKILKWYTPYDGIEESLFEITRDGVPVKYTGAHFKRPQPEEKDFVILKSGESFTRTVNLSEYYDFAKSGFYVIGYKVESLNLFEKNGSGLMNRIETLESNKSNVWAEGRKSSSRPQPPSGGGLNNFVGCSTTQQSSILTARDQAKIYSTESVNYLSSSANLGLRYTTWFGSYTNSRYNTVNGNFGNIKGAMDNAAMTFDCGCKKRYYAYVYPNQPYTIYLCSIFWQAPTAGTDSKAGTLVHETSHFSIVAGTDDYVYGQAGAKNLAITNPDQAVDNADSHEYFAENTPAQP